MSQWYSTAPFDRTRQLTSRLREHMATHCVQGRGVLVDLHRHSGFSSHAVSYEDLMRILGADQIEVDRGNIVSF